MRLIDEAFEDEEDVVVSMTKEAEQSGGPDSGGPMLQPTRPGGPVSSSARSTCRQNGRRRRILWAPLSLRKGCSFGRCRRQKACQAHSVCGPPGGLKRAIWRTTRVPTIAAGNHPGHRHGGSLPGALGADGLVTAPSLAHTLLSSPWFVHLRSPLLSLFALTGLKGTAVSLSTSTHPLRGLLSVGLSISPRSIGQALRSQP